MNKEVVDIVDSEVVVDEFSTVVVDRGPTRKQLKKIEKDYSDVLKEGDETIELTDAELSKEDLEGVVRLMKYIENARLATTMTEKEYVAVKRNDDDDVRELDCDFDMGRSLSGSRSMFED